VSIIVLVCNHKKEDNNETKKKEVFLHVLTACLYCCNVNVLSRTSCVFMFLYKIIYGDFSFLVIVFFFCRILFSSEYLKVSANLFTVCIFVGCNT